MMYVHVKGSNHMKVYFNHLLNCVPKVTIEMFPSFRNKMVPVTSQHTAALVSKEATDLSVTKRRIPQVT